MWAIEFLLRHVQSFNQDENKTAEPMVEIAYIPIYYDVFMHSSQIVTCFSGKSFPSL